METCINYCEPGNAYISSDERKWINKIRKLNSERPNECIIIDEPEDNGGFVYAKFPISWIKVRPPKNVSMSDEQRAKVAERLANYRRNSKKEE